MNIRKRQIISLLAILVGFIVHTASAQRSQKETPDIHSNIVLSQAPLSFEPNLGQTDSSVKFLARGDGYAVYLTPEGAVFKLRNAAAPQSQASVLRMQLLGANRGAQISGAEKFTGTVNYFIGNDRKQWHSGIATYGKVNYRGIYPGVDAIFYGNQRQLEYDFTVAPGADPSQIALGFSGAPPKFRDGNVVLSLHGDEVILHKPVLYQATDKKSVDGSYVVAGNRVRLRIGPYDHTQPLVIDPVISYLTYLGGKTPNGNLGVAVTSISCRPGACSNAAPEEQGIAVDNSGSIYITGQTWVMDFPTQDPFQATNKSATQWTAYVTKMNPTGTGLVYSTYLGGTGNDEADAIAIDASGNAYVIGQTYSGDFPTTPGSYTATCPVQSSGPPPITYCQTNGAAFLTKLSPDGQSLVYSTYIPIANLAMIHAVAVDSKGRAYISGDNLTYGNSNSTPASLILFPTTANALMPSSLVDQAVHPGTSNQGMAFVTVFSGDGSSLVYSTLFGDSNPAPHSSSGDSTGNYTRASGVAVDAAGNFYLAGYTEDPNLPVTANAFQRTYSAFGNNPRGFVAKFSSIDSTNGPQLVYATYLGATNTTLNVGDEIAGIAADATGSAHVTGITQSPDFPTTPGSFSPGPCAIGTYCNDFGFLTKIKPDGTGLAWSSYVGYTGSSYNGVTAIVPPRLDARGNVYVEVQTGAGYPVLNPVNTPGPGAVGLGITKFDPTGSKLFFSTLLGGAQGGYIGSEQYPAGVDVDPQGNIYVAGMTNRGDLPVTAGAFQTTFPLTSQNWSSFLAKIYPFFDTSVGLVIVPTTANLGQTVTFTATVGTNNNGTATGTVNFMNGVAQLGTGTLNASGIATFSTSSLAAGTYSVTAQYLGDDTFAPSTSNPQSLSVVGPTPQTITFAALPNVTYGVAPITLGATASSGLPVSYAVTGPATLNGSILSVTGVGTVNVTASQAGNGTFAPATPVSRSFTVAPAVLTVTATSVTISYGQPIPSLTYTVTGFVNGDPPALLSGNAQEATTATSTSPAGTYPITISQGTLEAANYTFAFVNGTLTISGGASQTITFGALPNVTYGVAPITLAATASSGLPVSYAVTGPATLSGSALTVTGVGTVSVTASQAGNANYAAATPVTRSFTVARAMLTATATSVTITYGQPIPTFTYAVTGFVNGETSAVLSGTPQESTTATSTSPAGTYPITITQGTLAAANYTFTLVNGILTISGGAAQTITFAALPNVTYGVSPITLSATASSGLPVSYAVTGPATLNGSALTITGVGTVSVTASQAGNANYAAATPVTRSFAVAPAVLTVTATNTSMSYGQPIPAFTYTTTGFVNGDTAGVLSGTPQESTTATSTSPAGTYPITITQGTLAAANYTFAFVNGTLTIGGGASQTITFAALPNVTYGAGPITLTATASSRLPVSYAVTGPATLSGSILTVTGVGTVNVTASQPGNTSYAAATPVTRTFTVSRAGLTVAATNASMAYGQPIPTFTYTVTGFVKGETTGVLSGVPQESTTATSTSAPGTYPITIAQGSLAAANYTFTFVNGNLTINAAGQTITFAAIPAQTVGTTLTLSASASSGLPVSFASLTPAVCTVAGTTASLLASGTCSIQASQSGNANYLAALSVTQSFSVSSSTAGGFTITPEPPSETIDRDDIAIFRLELHSVSGFKGKVALACSGGPAGSKCADFPQTVYVNGKAYAFARILLPRNASPGTHTITFTGTSGSQTATATAKLTVKRRGDRDWFEKK